MADKAPEGIRFSPPPNVSDLEFSDVSSSPLLSVLESITMNKSRNPSTAMERAEKKLELICAA